MIGGQAIHIADVWCIFEHTSGKKVEALRDVSIDILPGQFVCLVGRSGHGKSTLLRAIGGLNALTAGEIQVGERNVIGPSAERGMVFQDDTVFPWMRVRDNVEFGLKSQPIGAEEQRRIANEWLERVDLVDFADSWPKELSGGMRKRVVLATVFATGANILLMDEPFGSLDYVTRLILHSLLLDLWRSTEHTILFVTHDVEEALILADRILVMSHGRIVDDIIVDLERPRDEEIRAKPEAVRIIKTIGQHLGLGPVKRAHEQRRDDAIIAV
jgi:NitT/TauT family transport system ATP-binding protein